MKDLVLDAVARLLTAGVAPEILGQRRAPRRVLGIGRGTRIEASGEAWRVGALLLLPDGTMALPGETVRTQAESTRGYTAQDARHRADLRDQARRGGLPPGVLVHLDWRPVTTAEPPLSVDDDGEVRFAWSEGGRPVLLRRYLDDRVTLMLEQR